MPPDKAGGAALRGEATARSEQPNQQAFARTYASRKEASRSHTVCASAIAGDISSNQITPLAAENFVSFEQMMARNKSSRPVRSEQNFERATSSRSTRDCTTADSGVANDEAAFLPPDSRSGTHVGEERCGVDSSANNSQVHPRFAALRGIAETPQEGRNSLEKELGARAYNAVKMVPARPELRVTFWNLTYTVRPTFCGVPLSWQCCEAPMHPRSQQPVNSRLATRCLTDGQQVLHGLTGYFAPGEMVGLLGPSGSGKSTLLSVLSGRVRKGVGGQMAVNGKPLTGRIKKITGFVTQHESFFPTLTVEETLEYTARLRLGRTLTWAQKKAQVDKVIAAVNLGKCRRTNVGSADLRGLSCGELKRLCIASELLVQPALLLVDEPTSGLDSSTARDILALLRKVTDANRCTTVCAIHQPTADAFMSFDRVMFLRDGHCLYQGSPGSIRAYFSSLNFRCPERQNVADYVMHIIAATSPATAKVLPRQLEADSDPEVVDTADEQIAGRPPGRLRPTSNLWERFRAACGQTCFGRSGDRRSGGVEEAGVCEVTNRKDVLLEAYERRFDSTSYEMRLSDKGARPGTSETKNKHDEAEKDTISAFTGAEGDIPRVKMFERGLDKESQADSPRFCQQVWTLICRGVWIEVNKKDTYLDVLQGALLGLLLGFLYFQKLVDYSETLLRDRIGLLYFTSTSQAYGSAYGVLTSFPGERGVISKERSSEAYSLSSYLIAKTVKDLIIHGMAPTACLCLLYPLAGLPPGIITFLAFWGQLVLLALTAQATGELAAALVDSPRLGALLLSLFVAAAVLTGGFHADQRHLPPWISWLRWLSFINYSVTNFIYLSIGTRTLSCAEVSSFSCCPQSPITAAMVAHRYSTALPPLWNIGIALSQWLILKIFSYLAMKRSLAVKV